MSEMFVNILNAFGRLPLFHVVLLCLLLIGIIYFLKPSIVKFLNRKSETTPDHNEEIRIQFNEFSKHIDTKFDNVRQSIQDLKKQVDKNEMRSHEASLLFQKDLKELREQFSESFQRIDDKLETHIQNHIKLLTKQKL